MKFLIDRFKFMLKWSPIFILIAQIIAFVDRKVGLPTLHKFRDYVRDGVSGIPIYAQIIIIMLIFLFIIVLDKKLK